MARTYTFFVHLNARKEWLQLDRRDRNTYFDQLKREVFAKYPDVHIRLFDAEAFTTFCSDIMMCETDNIQHYYFMMEQLRDSKIYTTPYFNVIAILPAIEDGFIEFEHKALLTQTHLNQ